MSTDPAADKIAQANHILAIIRRSIDDPTESRQHSWRLSLDGPDLHALIAALSDAKPEQDAPGSTP